MRKFVLFALMFLFFTVVNAQRHGSVVRIDKSISAARVNDYMEYCHHRQYKDNWCWAACVQMVLDYYGIDVTQTKIVERAYGNDFDFTANKNDIIGALNGWHIGEQTIKASYEKYKNAKTLIDAIASGRPLIIGLNEKYTSTGHAYVLTHIFFTKDYNGNMTPTRVVVLNPANSGDLEESLDWSEFYKRINTIIKIKKN